MSAYHYDLERRADDADTYGAEFVAPNYLMDKLAKLSSQLRELEAFRDRMIAFTRSFAVDPESMRAIATATGLSHSTIMRIADASAIRSVAFSARDIAESILGWLTPQQDPDLYARLTKIVSDTKAATQD